MEPCKSICLSVSRFPPSVSPVVPGFFSCVVEFDRIPVVMPPRGKKEEAPVVEPPKDAAVAAPVAAPAVEKKEKAAPAKKRGKKRIESFSSYIYKVLRQVHPDTGISNRAMAIMNSFIYDTFERIATEASKLVRYGNSKTLTSREVQTAVRLVLPGELAKHAMSEGTKAVTKFTAART